MRWSFDANHSQVEWSCRYLGISVIKGAFNDVQAQVSMDAPDPAGWAVAVEIDPASVVSPGYPRREEALRGPNFLDVEQFPILRFVSRAFERTGGGLRVSGDLTLHGSTRELTLNGQENGEATDRRGMRRRGFSGTTTLKRSDFGVSVDGPMGVAEEIAISIEVQLILED
jgi:polyisoprenoid-binding protein YceI